MQKFLDEIQTHPLVVALVVFVGIFIVYNVFKKPSSSTTGLPAGTGTGTPLGPGYNTGVGGPTGTELYNSQLYQYPTYQQPVIQNIAPSPTPSTVPGVTPSAPASKNNYFGLLSQVGSEHPANIGPWTQGRQVNLLGQTYTLMPGPNGRLTGVNKANGQSTLLWNGNDYGPLGGSLGAHQLATTGSF